MVAPATGLLVGHRGVRMHIGKGEGEGWRAHLFNESTASSGDLAHVAWARPDDKGHSRL